MTTALEPRFVGVVNAASVALDPLPRAAPDMRSLADVLAARHHYQAALLVDLERGALLDAVDAELAPGALKNGTLIVAWTGHGRIGDDATLRLQGRAAGRDVDVAAAGQLGEWAARTGARQVLVLIDTCYSGGGLVDAVKLAAAVNSGRSTPGTAWFGVIAASLGDEPALSGALARELLRVLSQGPRRPDFRWDRTRPRIRGDDLAQALLQDWTEPRQTPYAMSFGLAADLVDNPLHEPGMAEQPIEHLLLAARGSSGVESFFTGRVQALAQITAWLARGEPGLLVVTGPPGCGKSALVGRIASLSSSAERARLLATGPVDAALDPGESSVDAQLQARGLTVDAAAENLAAQLGVDTAQGLFGLLGEARRRRLAGAALVVLVDGLDEARVYARDLAVELITPLAREALVLVATRDMRLDDTTLVEALKPTAGTLDLGADPEQTQRDMHAYVVRRLAGVDPAMDAQMVAAELAPEGPSTTAAPFLLARLVTSQLREHPVDTSGEGWRLALAATVESALERDLQSVVLHVDGHASPGAARELFRALALAHGRGFPADDVWPAVATAISSSASTYGRDEVYAVLGALGRHIVASSEDEQPVYRIAHQRLVDYLLGDAARGPAARAAQNLQGAVAAAVYGLYSELLDSGLDPRAHPYLWRHAWRHLAEAGAAGLDDLRRLVERDRGAFLQDLALGSEYAAALAWSAGDAEESLRLRESAAASWREIDDPMRLASALFHVAIARSSVGDGEGADAAAREASVIARRLAEQPQGRQVLGDALLARGLTQLREGQYHAAQLLAAEVIALAGDSVADVAEAVRLATAHVLAGQVAIALGELDAAARHCSLAVQTIDRHGAAEEGRVVLLEALASATVFEYTLAALAAPDAAGVYAPAATSAGLRLLQEYRQRGGGDVASDMALSKGMLFLVRNRLFDQQRGLAPGDGDARAEIDSIVDDAIALVRPHAEQFADAALLLASGAQLRAQIAMAPERQSRLADLVEAIALLRPYASRSAGIAAELGVLLYTHVQASTSGGLLGTPDAAQGLVEELQEAAALLRRSDSWMHRSSLAAALGTLALLQLQLGGRSDLEVASRAECIEVWRSLVDAHPEARAQLAGQLVDQAGRLLETRSAEAIELAEQARAIAAALPPQRYAVLHGLAELNLAAARMRVGNLGPVRAGLAAAIARLEPQIANPVIAAAFANACMNRAQLEVLEGHPTEALGWAERAVAMFETPGIPPFLAVNRWLGRVVLGQAQRGVGDEAGGKATLRAVIEPQVRAVLDGTDDGSALVGTLNFAASDMWDEVLAAVADRPELVQRFGILRRRPTSELALTVRSLLEALASATPQQLREVRSVVRMQRQYAAAEFDAAWRAAHGEDADWLRLEPNAEQLVIAWWNTPSWTLSRDYLESHPALLDPMSDIVLEEFGFGEGDRSLVDRHVQLLAGARSVGAAAAYAPLLLAGEVSAWLRSSDPRAHLERHPQLLRPEVLALLRDWAAEGDAQSAVFASIVVLAQRDEAALAFQAAEEPAAMRGQLQAAWRSTDMARLVALATIVLHDAQEDSLRRVAAVALLIAAAIERRDGEPDPALGAALAELGDDSPTLTGQVTDAIVHHPADAALLAPLVARLAPAAAPG